MSSYTPPNLTTGIDDILVQTIGQVPTFVPMLLIFVFGIIFLGGITSQKRRLGTADVPMWTVMASMGALLVALPMTMIEGFMPLEILSVVVIVTLFSGLWLFLNRNRNEI